MKWTKRWRKRLRLLVSRDAVERELAEELAFHLELETRKNVQAGMELGEARRRAMLAFGGVEKFKEEVRDARWFGWLTGLSLDVRLGARMLVKYPGLTLVGGLGLAVGVALSVSFFSVMAWFYHPILPLDEGDRIVALENRDTELNDEERRSLHDFAQWRDELRLVEDLGAFRTVESNLTTGEGAPELVQVAEISAAGFRVARVPPLVGRYLVDGDERAGAPPVVVLGYDVWRTRFASDPGVVGRQVRLDGTVRTVVGVMPEGFAFPVNHQLWFPLRAEPAAYERREGPEIFIFGRLAPGVTMEQAQAELTAIGRRTAAAFPETNATLRPMVMPYTYSITDVQGGTSLWNEARMQLMMSLLLIVVALNVAVLVYARTAMRRGELSVRSALGASRRRIVAQLFAEALVLAAGSAALGFALAHFGVRLGFRIMAMEQGAGARAPFWQDYGFRPAAVLFTIGLAAFVAAVVGILPALQATGRRLQSGLHQRGSSTGMRLGRMWTALIVGQVAVAVALLPVAANVGWVAIRAVATRPSYAVQAFLTAPLGMDPNAPPVAGGVAAPQEANARFGDRVTDLLRRLEAEPAVAGATFRASLPDRGRMIRVEGRAAPPESPAGHEISSLGVGPGYFGVFGLRLLTGRKFESGDLGAQARAVIVSRAFVRQVLDGGRAVGRRIRYVDRAKAAGSDDGEPGRWYEIVGVVADQETSYLAPDLIEPVVFYPVAPARAQEVRLLVRLRGATPAGFAPRLREISVAVDPSLRLGMVRSLAERDRTNRMAARGVGLAVGLILLSVLLLSAAGISALMSFVVTQRRREIGIRSALGAPPRHVLRSVFARAARQIGLGVAVGIAMASLLERLTGGGLMGGRGAAILPALALAVTVVGLLAALGPARRGLKIQPTEALREE